ncbi:MAG TPA: AAA-like domain-containing protein, partial [Allocoleopsis sp.]
QNHAELLQAMQHILTANSSIDLTPSSIFKLQSMGLIHKQNLQIVPSCKLYHQFFSQFFNKSI